MHPAFFCRGTSQTAPVGLPSDVAGPKSGSPMISPVTPGQIVPSATRSPNSAMGSGVPAMSGEPSQMLRSGTSPVSVIRNTSTDPLASATDESLGLPTAR